LSRLAIGRLTEMLEQAIDRASRAFRVLERHGLVDELNAEGGGDR
jgi:hypothetical protein